MRTSQLREEAKEQSGGHGSLVPERRSCLAALQLHLIWTAGLEALTAETGSISRLAAEMSLQLTDPDPDPDPSAAVTNVF